MTQTCVGNNLPKNHYLNACINLKENYACKRMAICTIFEW